MFNIDFEELLICTPRSYGCFTPRADIWELSLATLRFVFMLPMFYYVWVYIADWVFAGNNIQIQTFCSFEKCYLPDRYLEKEIANKNILVDYFLIETQRYHN